MRYYIDTEFLEGTQKSWFGRNTKPTIDLISIGIVCEDNRELYLISKDFNLKEAWNRYDKKDTKYIDNGGLEAHLDEVRVYWIRDNVLKPIWCELTCIEQDWNKEVFYKNVQDLSSFNNMTYRDLKRLINKYGKTNKQIAEEIKVFTKEDKNIAISVNPHYVKGNEDIRFYGYYSAYDHVCMCWCFGKMIDLPKNFPMYTFDLKQMLDEKQLLIGEDSLKDNEDYPKQEHEHSALHDARWNKKLHEFLQTIDII